MKITSPKVTEPIVEISKLIVGTKSPGPIQLSNNTFCNCGVPDTLIVGVGVGVIDIDGVIDGDTDIDGVTDGVLVIDGVGVGEGQTPLSVNTA